MKLDRRAFLTAFVGGVAGIVGFTFVWFVHPLVDNVGLAAGFGRRKFLLGVASLTGILVSAAVIVSASPLYYKMWLSRRVSRRSFLIGVGGVAGGAAIATGGWLSSSSIRNLFLPDVSLTDLDVLASKEKFDVCIIGSGPAGTVLGLDLIRQGFRTIILESGPEPRQRPSSPEFDALDIYQSSGLIDYPISTSRFRALGGTSNLWTGRCSRFHPIDFEINAYTPPGSPWPISYDEIEPYYEQAERTLNVRGGKLSSNHAPRRSDLPLPSTWENTELKSLMQGVGITIDDSPTSTGLIGQGPIRIARDLLPEFSEHPAGTLVSGVTVTRLTPDDNGEIIGAEVHNMDGDEAVVNARLFVIACGAIEASRLLLLSKSGQFPEGIGNSNDLVGKFFGEHPNLTFSGNVSKNGARSFGRCHQFYDEFKHQGLGSIILVVRAGSSGDNLTIGATIEMESSVINTLSLWNGNRDSFGNEGINISMGFTERDSQTLEEARSLIRRIYGDLNAQEVEERPLAWSHHHIGGCRMGHDPKTSVVDANLRVHETRNLYVAGSGTFVTGGAAHPTLLITALSHRLAEHLSSEALTSSRGSPSLEAVAQS